MGDDRSLAGAMKYWSLSRSLLLILLCLVAAGCKDRQQNLWVDDRAGVLEKAQVERLNRYHKVLFDQLDVHFKVVILEKASVDIDKTSIEEFGTLGEKTSAARGLLFLVDPKSQQARIEVGYDLEHIFPDGFVGNVEELQMKPFFAKGLVGAGIEAVGELLVQRLLQGEQAKQRQKLPSQQYYSGGGGAKVETKAAPAHYEKQAVSDPSVYSGAATPEEALELYQQVLAQHIKDPNLPLYTSATRKFFAQWVVTDAQQNNELQNLQRYTPVKVIVQERLAVIRYPVEDRTVPPYFLELGKDGWMLDFAAMSRIIQFNHRNQWRMKSTDHPYMFGFADLAFDENGFPLQVTEK